MTAKEQGLPAALASLADQIAIYAGDADGSRLDRLAAHWAGELRALAALASDTGERGVRQGAVTYAVKALRDLAAVIRKHGTCAPAALEEVAKNLSAALRAQPAGGGGSWPAGCLVVPEDGCVPHVHPQYGSGLFFTEDAALTQPQPVGIPFTDAAATPLNPPESGGQGEGDVAGWRLK